ncbi:MAG: hypothetical protein HYZ71_09970 [Deltaproteobacteria bacterium]|nr:hypothetical protein [Deltaproteobacteria bacterium]
MAGLFCVLIAAKGVLELLSDKFQRPTPRLLPATAEVYGKNLKRYSFGFDSVIAAGLWVDLLQRARHEMNRDSVVSWEYVQIDAITRLDPLFERAYDFGGVVLSVLIQDKQGAKRILERWALRRPRSWRVHYLLGYHLFFELKDYEGASRHILRAAEMEGAPSWLNALAVRLLSETGALEESLRLCISLYDQVTDTEGKDRLSLRIRSLNYKLQERAWISSLERYRVDHHREPRSTAELGPNVVTSVREVASSVAGNGIPVDLTVLLRERFPFRYDEKTRGIVSSVGGSIGPREVGIFRPKAQ